MFVAKFFKKKLQRFTKTILEARCPLLMFSLDVEFYLAFHAEGKKTFLYFLYYPKGHLQAFKRVLENKVFCQLLRQKYCTCNYQKFHY